MTMTPGVGAQLPQICLIQAFLEIQQLYRMIVQHKKHSLVASKYARFVHL